MQFGVEAKVESKVELGVGFIVHARLVERAVAECKIQQPEVNHKYHFHFFNY